MGTFQSYRLDPGHESLPDKLLPPQWTPLQKRGSAQAHDSQTTVQTYIETSSRRRSMATQHPGRSPSWQWTRLHCAETGPPWHGKRMSRTGLARRFARCKKDQPWFSERFTGEHKINITWDHRWTEERTASLYLESDVSSQDSQLSRSLSESPDHHQTKRW